MKPSPSPSIPATRNWIVLRPWMLVLLVAGPVTVGFLPWIMGPRIEPEPATQPSSPSPTALPPTVQTGLREGPWGALTLTPITIQPPAKYIPPRHYQPRPLQWLFGQLSREEVRALLIEHGLPATWADDLRPLNPTGDSTWMLNPEAATVSTLAPRVPGGWYRALVALDPRNRDFFGAQRWSQAQVQDVLTRLPNAARPLLEAMLFPSLSNDDVHFWDLYPLLAFLPREVDRIAVVRILLEQSTLLLTVDISSATPVSAVADYWRLPSSRRQILPMLESLAELPRVTKLDALHLMTPFIREYAYTYPVTALAGAVDDLPDCFWTCANFDRRGDQSLIAGDDSADYLMAHYGTYLGRPEFGDIVVLRDEADQAIHVAVHIADTVVFTKNGQHPLVPWIFVELPDLMRVYDNADPARTLWVRRKPSL